MKALLPAPVTTRTRTSGSAANFSTISPAAVHISSDTALWRSGLLKIIQPIPPSFFAIILSVGMPLSLSAIFQALRRLFPPAASRCSPRRTPALPPPPPHLHPHPPRV